MTVFRRCDWPPGPGADSDGYSEITAVETRGPGESEGTDANVADIIKSSCSVLKVSYSIVAQGSQKSRPPVTLAPDRVVYWTGKKWRDTGNLPFVYEQDELVVLRNYKTRLDDVRCVK